MASRFILILAIASGLLSLCVLGLTQEYGESFSFRRSAIISLYVGKAI